MKKYEPLYFGAAAGAFAVVLFILVVINIVASSNDELVSRLLPLIPFMTAINFLTVLGGLFVSFLWGFFLGYLFIIIYNFYDRILGVNNNR